MQDGSYQKGQGINLATNSFTYNECQFLANILRKNYNLKTTNLKDKCDSMTMGNKWSL